MVYDKKQQNVKWKKTNQIFQRGIYLLLLCFTGLLFIVQVLLLYLQLCSKFRSYIPYIMID